jgi:FKBP-type peptidyl-prolyl cis-trans isomerase
MKNFLVLFLSVLLFASCSSDSRETASGQKFTVVRKGDGVAIDSGKFLIMNFLFKDGKDSIWNDTRKSGIPLIMQKQGILRPGDRVLEVINMLSKGDSVSFQVPAKEIFSKSFRQPVPPGVDSLSNFTFIIGVTSAMDREQFQKFQQELVAKQNEKMLNQKKEQLGKDTVIIDQYLADKGIKATKTASGLRYIVTKPGKGENVKDGQTVKVDYAGYLLNGKYFDTSFEPIAKEKGLHQEGKTYAPIEFRMGPGSVIEGWGEMLKLMNKGSQVTVYIPSTLAYGNQKRSNEIIENTILVFDMTLVDFK